MIPNKVLGKGLFQVSLPVSGGFLTWDYIIQSSHIFLPVCISICVQISCVLIGPQSHWWEPTLMTSFKLYNLCKNSVSKIRSYSCLEIDSNLFFGGEGHKSIHNTTHGCLAGLSNHFVTLKVKVIQSCLTLCDPMDSTVHGILQARILEWVTIPCHKGSSQPGDQSQLSRIAGRFFTSWATREAYLPTILKYSWYTCLQLLDMTFLGRGKVSFLRITFPWGLAVWG